jgi:hypothetical protein
MDMTRRMFTKQTGTGLLVLATAGGSSFFLEGCPTTPASWLTEASNIIKLIGPLVEGIIPIVGLVDPPLAPLITTLDGVVTVGLTALAGLLDKWAGAAATAQPGILADIQAAVTAVKTNLANLIAAAQVKSQTAAAEISSIASAVLDELSNLLTIIPQIQTAGGTMKAARLVVGDYYSRNPYDKTQSVRSSMVKRLNVPTGNAALDTVRTNLSQKLAAVVLK